MSMAITNDGWIGRWSPGLADPSPAGWVTVAAYVVVVWLCWRARADGHASGDRVGERMAMLWGAFAAGLIVLGFDRLLDLQAALAESVRLMAHDQGWYGDRRPFQLRLIELMVLADALFGLLLVYLARQNLGRMIVAIVGVVELVGFVLIRGVSYHYIDSFLRLNVAGVRSNTLFELGGLVLIGVGAIRYASARRGGTPGP